MDDSTAITFKTEAELDALDISALADEKFRFITIIRPGITKQVGSNDCHLPDTSPDRRHLHQSD